MDSPNHPSPTIDNLAVVAQPSLNSNAPLFFPNPLRVFHFLAPPIYFIPDTIHLPPPSIYVYYPLWYPNPNPNPSQELELPSPTTGRRYENSIRRKRFYGRRRSNKVVWRRRSNHELESNGDRITTVMLRNIPNKYTREMMINFLDKHCEEANKNEEDEEFSISAYDFFYLPIDFMSRMNKGYAFVNFTNAEAVVKFKVACNNKPWLHFGSSKILEIANARIQGKEELVKHFEQMTYPVEEYSAVCFSPARSGPEDTVQTIMVGSTEPVISVY